MCQDIFTKTISDEEAMQDYLQSPVYIPGDSDLGLVCDDCYNKLLDWL